MQAITEDSIRTRPDDRLIVFLLLCSAIAHGLFIVIVRPFDLPDAVSSVSHSFAVQLASPVKPVPASAAPAHQMPETTKTGSAIIDPVTPNTLAKSISGQKQALVKPVPERKILTKDAIRAAILAYSAPGPETENTTDTGAVVMDLALLRRLNNAQRRAPGSADTAPGAIEFSGGAWLDLVRFGDKCFRVQSANPLQPMSHETWYRVACK